MNLKSSYKVKYFFASLLNRLKRKKPKKNKKKISKNSKKEKTLLKNELFFKSLKLILVVILTAIFIYFVVIPIFYILTNFKLSPAFEAAAPSRWWGKERLNVLFVLKDKASAEHEFVDAVCLIIYDPEKKSVSVFNINPDINVYSTLLGKQVNVRTALNMPSTEEYTPYEVLKEGIENLVAIKINRYVFLEKAGFAETSEMLMPARIDLTADLYDEDVQDKDGKILNLKKGKRTIFPEELLAVLSSDQKSKNQQLVRQMDIFKELISNTTTPQYLLNYHKILVTLGENIETDFNEIEFVTWLWRLTSVRKDLIKIAYTRSTSLIPGQSFGVYKSYNPIIERIDNDLSEIIFNSNILKEQAKIEVLNGSGISGLAGLRTRWITNAGGRVIHFGNSPKGEEVTKVYVQDPEKFNKTLQEIELIFNGKIEYPKEEYRYKHVGDIVIVIGEEYK